MRPWFAAAVAAVIAALAVPTVGAQSLAEIAERTKKKEAEKGKPTGKVYTESDLRGRAAGSGSMSQMDGPVAVAASPAPGAAGATPAAGGPAAKTPEQEQAEREADWRARLTKANEDVTRISAEIDRAQLALNDISGPLYGGTRGGLITRVEEGQRQLVIAKKTVEDLQEEGRRARYRQ